MSVFSYFILNLIVVWFIYLFILNLQISLLFTSNPFRRQKRIKNEKFMFGWTSDFLQVVCRFQNDEEKIKYETNVFRF